MGFGMLFGACIKIECIASLVRVKCIVLHVRFINPARSRIARGKAISSNKRAKAVRTDDILIPEFAEHDEDNPLQPRYSLTAMAYHAKVGIFSSIVTLQHLQPGNS
jgi:hypothetical protein